MTEEGYVDSRVKALLDSVSTADALKFEIEMMAETNNLELIQEKYVPRALELLKKLIGE